VDQRLAASPSGAVSVGVWVRQLRQRRGETQATFGQRLGFSKETVRSVETRGVRPSREFAAQLGHLLGVPAARVGDFDRFVRQTTAIQVDTLPGWLAELVAADEPPLTGALPTPATPLIDRVDELAALDERLHRRSARLVALTGPPGIGKTRLALQAAAMATDYQNGVFFVELAPLEAAAQVTTAIATSLGLPVGDRPPPTSVLARYLAPRQVLLVLDNFEHVEAAAPVLGELLGAAPQLKLLVTSRHAPRVYGSHEQRVPPLGLPESMELFVQRAQAVCADFELCATNVDAVEAICTQLEGVPLAIELAAARCRSFDPHTLQARLQHPLAVLVDGPLDRPPRQQTLRGAIDWSHRLLGPEEQRLLARLAVYPGGCPLEAMLARTGPASDEVLVRHDLEALVDRSLLERRASDGELPRYHMLESVRQYGLEQLDVRGELEAERRWHAAYFAQLAEHGSDARLHLEQRNLRAAHRWALEQRDATAAQALAVALR